MTDQQSASKPPAPDTDTADGESALASDAHEFNEQWVWSDAFTRFVRDHIPDDATRTLKVCTGFRDICDVNVDIDLEGTHADTYGDMFDLPFDANEFDATVADPPWNDFSDDQKATLVEELVRVTEPGGTVLLNARFFPDHIVLEQADYRVRQEDDFGGNTSLITFSEKDDWIGVYKRSDYDALPDDPENDATHQSYVYQTRIKRRADTLDKETSEVETDPQAVDWMNQSKTCPACGFSGLVHAGPGSQFETDAYECRACGRPAIAAEFNADLTAADLGVDPERLVAQVAAQHPGFREAVAEVAVAAAEARSRPDVLPTYLKTWVADRVADTDIEAFPTDVQNLVEPRLDGQPGEDPEACTETPPEPNIDATGGATVVNIATGQRYSAAD